MDRIKKVSNIRPMPSPMKARGTGDKNKKKKMSVGKAGKQKEQSSPVKGDGSRMSPIRLEESDDEARQAKQAEFDGASALLNYANARTSANTAVSRA